MRPIPQETEEILNGKLQFLRSVTFVVRIMLKLLMTNSNKTRNTTLCNNRDDLLYLSFNNFGGLYITQSKIYDGAFIAKIVSR